MWVAKQQIARSRRGRVWAGAFLMLATPKIPYSPKHHAYADMRNFLGVPNTLNVITNFPFLIVGVLGFVLSLQGSYLNVILQGEIMGWTLFYVGIAGVAFGSAYYHLKPDESRVVWDTLPMMMAYSSLISGFLVERVGKRTGLCLFSLLLFFSLLSVAYERTFNDLRLRMMFQLIPCVVIPFMTLLFPPKYTHSRYWLWAADQDLGIIALARVLLGSQVQKKKEKERTARKASIHANNLVQHKIVQQYDAKSQPSLGPPSCALEAPLSATVPF